MFPSISYFTWHPSCGFLPSFVPSAALGCGMWCCTPWVLLLALFWQHAGSQINLGHVLGGNRVIQTSLENRSFLSPCLCFPSSKMASCFLESVRNLCWCLGRGYGAGMITDKSRFPVCPQSPALIQRLNCALIVLFHCESHAARSKAFPASILILAVTVEWE